MDLFWLFGSDSPLFGSAESMDFPPIFPAIEAAPVAPSTAAATVPVLPLSCGALERPCKMTTLAGFVEISMEISM